MIPPPALAHYLCKRLSFIDKDRHACVSNRSDTKVHSYCAYIDGLRAVGVIAVVLLHAK